ncbi:hypothetical protein MPER_07096, partial [Moniliophthora perniciosa FA553]
APLVTDSLLGVQIEMPELPLHAHGDLQLRLLHAGKKFGNAFAVPLTIAAVHGFLRIMDIHPDAPTEQVAGFIARFKEMSHNYVWAVTVKEKRNASRIGEPHARDVYYVFNSGRLLAQNTYPRGNAKMRELIAERESDGQYTGAIVIGIHIQDRDFEDRNPTPMSEFTLTRGIPNIAALQYGYFTTQPEIQLALCGI